MIKLHARTQKVALARIDITKAVIEICAREQLTFVESMQALADTIQSLAKWNLRRERHPKKPAEPADLE